MRSNEELVTAIKAGEKEAMNQLCYQCKGFICQQAMRWGRAWKNRPSFDTDDLIQAGYMAIYDAVEHYQPERGGFLNFLTFYLKTEFSNVAGCRTPAQMNEPLNTAISLDSPVKSDSEGELTIADTIPAEEEGFCNIEESMYHEELKKVIHEALQSLPERNGMVIDGHYLKGETQTALAEKLNVTTGRAGELIRDGLRLIRKSKYMQPLQEFMWMENDCYQYTGYNAWRASGCSVQERAMVFKKIVI